MIARLLTHLPIELHGIVLQISRYAIAGLIITLAMSASYWALTDLAGLDPMVSFTLAFLVFWVVSYVTHGAFSFKDHGSRDRQHVRLTRYLAVTVLGFCLNQFFVWSLVKHMHGPTWWPIVPVVFVTPFILFALMRKYVYA